MYNAARNLGDHFALSYGTDEELGKLYHLLEVHITVEKANPIRINKLRTMNTLRLINERKADLRYKQLGFFR